VTKDRVTRAEDAAPAPTERVLGGAFLPLGLRTSDRCRARHDVPYSLRCIHHAGHQPMVKHMDKEMNEW
jgi:hypothetical protein